MIHQDELTGTVERFLFKNEENGYSVFILHLKDKQAVTVKGYCAAIHPGELVQVQGAWVTHPKFGRQFEAQSCAVSQPTSLIGLKKYLSSGLIKGIGKVYGEKLVDYFGAEVLEVIEHKPHLLTNVPGIGQKRIEQIVQAWQGQKDISKIMVFLQEHRVSPAYAVKIYKKYGHESVALLKENPYRLAEEVWGIGFKMADTIAQSLGFEVHSVKRVKAGIQYALTEATNRGHLYAELETLKKETVELLTLEEERAPSLLKQALHELFEADKIKLLSHQSQHYITLSKFYYSEKAVAHKLLALLERAPRVNFDLDAVYQEIRLEREGEVALNDDQQKGILNCLQNKVSIITGGPGTGKTTLIKKLLTILDSQRIIYKLAAPTGRAAKRMQEGTRKPALTIHRLLEFDVGSMAFKHNEHNALPVQFLIIDEASMIDVFLAQAVLRAMPLDAHIIFIGDIDQLPSVGAGNFLGDMIASGQVPYTRLTQIFRQAQNSMIIVNAHRINKGEFPTSHIEDARHDYYYIKEEAPENLMQHLTKIFKGGLQKFGIHKDQATVLVPMNRGIAGTIQLNQNLQQLLNPQGDKEIMAAGTLFRVHDRVMQIRNNYDKNTFNGDIGTIVDVDTEDRKILVNFDGREIEYESDELAELVLAYAISIHKSQGSEYDAVIVPVFMQHFMLLQRNLLYTAITRAKKLCIFIGQAKAIGMGVKNNKTMKRLTFLQQFLTTDLEAR